jgi:hypothetical protein
MADSRPRRILSAAAGIFLTAVLVLTFVGTFIV